MLSVQKGSLTYVRKSLPPLQHGKIADIHNRMNAMLVAVRYETIYLYQPCTKARMTQRDMEEKDPLSLSITLFVMR